MSLSQHERSRVKPAILIFHARDNRWSATLVGSPEVKEVGWRPARFPIDITGQMAQKIWQDGSWQPERRLSPDQIQAPAFAACVCVGCVCIQIANSFLHGK